MQQKRNDHNVSLFYLFYFYLFNQTVYHRIEGTKSQVQYPRHQSLRTLIQTMKISLEHTHQNNAVMSTFSGSYVHTKVLNSENMKCT